jgi:hypothetical protein
MLLNSTRPLVLVLVPLLMSGCSSTTGAERFTDNSDVRLDPCTGPATSLDPVFAAMLEWRGGVRDQNEQWADLARRVPGGFAGVMFDHAGRPVLFLTDVTRAAEAKTALAGAFADRFDLANAEVRVARWNYAQLRDWQAYLTRNVPRSTNDGVNGFGIDVALNRLTFFVDDAAARDRLVETWSTMNLPVEVPCDLVNIKVTGPIVDG